MTFIKCSQCERQAIGAIANGTVPLCVEHYALLQQTLSKQQADNERLMNYLLDQMDESIGIPSYARFRTPAPIVRTGSTILNQLKIDGSTIGVLNTGTIDNLNSTISLIQNSGNKELADAIKNFTEAVAKNIEITNESKKETIEQLSFLATQIRTPEKNRNFSVIKTIFSAISKTIITSVALVNLWEKLKSMIEPLLK